MTADSFLKSIHIPLWTLLAGALWLGTAGPATGTDPAALQGIAVPPQPSGDEGYEFHPAGLDARLTSELQILAGAYPETVRNLVHAADGTLQLIMHDGSAVVFEDGQEIPYPQVLDDPDLRDTLAQPYPRGPVAGRVAVGSDPGRIRAEAFFMAVYGRTSAEVAHHCRSPTKFMGSDVPFNRRNGAATALQEVGDKLSTLIGQLKQSDPDRAASLKSFFTGMGGTFAWRTIARTGRLSPHSFGIAIDLNPVRGLYWQYGPRDGEVIDRHLRDFPGEIVEAFEGEGFIWGGKWHHYDSMHFEYRPELFAAEPIGKVSP